MTSRVPIAGEHETLRQIHDMLHRSGNDFKTINYVYVLDSGRRLLGVLSVRELFRTDLDVRAGDVCTKNDLVFVHPSTHQERAAYLALKYTIKAIPVVSHKGVFLGEITSDSILRILHKEMHEDSLRRAGIRHPDALHGSVLTLTLFASFRHRIPWLLIGLGGGLLVAKVIGFFGATLEENLILASFIPLIVYMSSAVGTQMETYIIRDLATEQKLPIQPYLLRNSAIVIAIAVSLSSLLLLSYGILSDNWFVAAVLGVSLFASICSSLVTGIIIPYAFSKLALDPADASGPIATILQDAMSIVIYFGIATMML